MAKEGLEVSPEVFEKLWANVAIGGDNECWPWQKGLSNGYGAFVVSGIAYRSHRVALASRIGQIPAGLLACHTCDNRKCCNPLHIYAGTSEDNARDLAQRGPGEPIETGFTSISIYASVKEEIDQMIKLAMETGGDTNISRLIRRALLALDLQNKEQA